jgi:hypothetical protein
MEAGESVIRKPKNFYRLPGKGNFRPDPKSVFGSAPPPDDKQYPRTDFEMVYRTCIDIPNRFPSTSKVELCSTFLAGFYAQKSSSVSLCPRCPEV